MKLLDTNLLVYTVDERSSRHDAASRWVEEVFGSPETVGLAWLALIGFVRLTTNARIVEAPLDVERAMDLVDGWLDRPNVTVLEPTDRHSGLVRELLRPLGTAGNLTSDAHLAALAIEHGAELCSCDVDFSRFAGLRWTNPLA